MPVLPLKVIADGDNCWPDLADKIERGEVIHLAGSGLELALLPGGMSSGAASVSLRVDLPDGRTVVCETSMALLECAVRAFQAALAGIAERAAKGSRA